MDENKTDHMEEEVTNIDDKENKVLVYGDDESEKKPNEDSENKISYNDKIMEEIVTEFDDKQNEVVYDGDECEKQLGKDSENEISVEEKIKEVDDEENKGVYDGNDESEKKSSDKDNENETANDKTYIEEEFMEIDDKENEEVFDSDSEYRPSKDSEDEAADDDQIYNEEEILEINNKDMGIVFDSDNDLEYKPNKDSEYETANNEQSEKEVMEIGDNENKLVHDSDDDTDSLVIPLQNKRNIVLLSPNRTEDTKRSNKYHVCVFCNRSYPKQPRHFEDVHFNESKVKEALSLRKHSKERKKAWLVLQNLGDYNHNVEVLKSGKGVLIPKYTTRKGDQSRKYQAYLPCKFCLGLYVKDELWKHQKRCGCNANDGKNVKNTPIQDGKLLLPPVLGSKELHRNILMNMKEDDVKEKITSDDLILEYGRRLYEDHGHAIHRHPYISQKLRELGRLLIAANEENLNTLEQCLFPENWELLLRSVKVVAGFSSENGTFKIPSLPLKIGHSLNRCAKIKRTNAIQTSDDILRKEMQGFLDMYETEWTERITSKAHSTLNMAKFNRPQLLPLVEDITNLHKYLDNKTTQIKCSNLTDKQKYRDLAEICLTRIILFNRKRSGETQRITVKNYESVLQSQTVDEEIMKSITPFERELCKTHKRIEIIGKKGSRVPVILTEKMMSDIGELLQLRSKLEVPNDYLFGKPESRFPFRGNDCLRRLSFESGAKKPELIKSTELPKQMATLSQVLGLTENNQDILAKFLGHDIRIHRQYYRLPDSSYQLAKVSKILHGVNQGKIAEFRGKNLDEIEFNTNDLLEVESDDDDANDDEQEEEFTNEDDPTDVDMRTVCGKQNIKMVLRKNECKKWTKQEIDAVERQLANHLKMRKIPKKLDCVVAKNKEKSLQELLLCHILDMNCPEDEIKKL
ncbi:hypothetical protein KUTeg_011278 [Tegillarca granosa]|uniref:Uncharacterized protein n=1 Tax=Tegillarca granosa TaxID=220873 RepID=A0ABQ9F4G7_TEGGR|nr:hypothetical protein KUTeg_011278 [Tegillarca granosa]